MTFLPADVVDVVGRVDGERVHVEAVVTQRACARDEPLPPPVRLAELRRRRDLTACPIGESGARVWPGGFGLEPPVAGLFAPRPRSERARLQSALTSFSGRAKAFVIGCPQGRAVEWLFVEEPQVGLQPRVAFFDADGVRVAPGHENVLFPTPLAPPSTTPAPLVPPEQPVSEGPEAPEPVPPRVTATGCPPERLDAQWVVRRFGSTARPPGERSMPGPETLERWSLRLEGAIATLVAAEEHRTKTGEWACRTATAVQGTVERRGPTIALRFGSVFATCREAPLLVQPAHARRHPKRLPQRIDEEGCERYRWVTSTPVRAKALVCTGELPLNSLLVFGAAPGVERLVLENDCQPPERRDALRLVPADGRVRPAM